MSEKIQESLNKHDQIKNKIAEYLLEKHKTRNSLLKKDEIVSEINNNFTYNERNDLLDYISDLTKNISDYFNSDDQHQIFFLLKDLNAGEGHLRQVKMDLCELCATIMNETGPLAKKNKEPLGDDVYGELQNSYSESRERLKDSEYSFISGTLKSGGMTFYLENEEDVDDLGNNRFRVMEQFRSESGFERGGQKIINIILSPDGEHIIKDDNNKDMTIIPDRKTINLFGLRNSDVKENRLHQSNIPDKEHHMTYVRYFTHQGDLVTLKFSKKRGNVQYNIIEY